MRIILKHLHQVLTLPDFNFAEWISFTVWWYWNLGLQPSCPVHLPLSPFVLFCPSSRSSGWLPAPLTMLGLQNMLSILVNKEAIPSTLLPGSFFFFLSAEKLLYFQVLNYLLGVPSLALSQITHSCHFHHSLLLVLSSVIISLWLFYCV